MTYAMPCYYTAVVLNPKCGLRWFDTWWKDYPAWIVSVKMGMAELYEKHVKEMKTAGIPVAVEDD